MEKFWFFMTLMLDIVPFALISLIMLRDKMPCSFVSGLLKTILPLVIYNFIICETYMSGMYGATAMVALRLLGDVLVYILLCLTFRKYYLQFIYKCLFTLPYMLGILQISALIINFINTGNQPAFKMITILRFIFTLLITYPYYQIEKRMVVSNFDMKDNTVWGYFTGSQFILDLAMMLTLRTDYATNGIDSRAFAQQIIMLLASTSVTAVLFHVLKLSGDMIVARDKQMRDELLLELSSRQYSSIQENIQMTRQVRHDMKHHLRTIDRMMAEKRYDEVTEYLKEYKANMPEGAKIQFCGNLTINALLEYYYSMAENREIEVSFDVSELADCRIRDIDLNILLGNALENAIEGCENVEKDKFIRLCVKKIAGKMFITIDNTFDGVLKNRKGVLLSRKRSYERAGFGNASMDAVAERYGGQVKREISGSYYQVSIVLNDEHSFNNEASAEK